MTTDNASAQSPYQATTPLSETTSGKTTSGSGDLNFSPAALSALSAALLVACGGGGGSANTPAAPLTDPNLGNAPGFNNFPKATSDEQAARFILQSQLSANDEEITAAKTGSYALYLLQQFAKPVGQTGWQWLEERGYGQTPTIYNYFFSDYPAVFMLWSQLFAAPDNMRKRMALALSEFFVASLQSAEFTWRSHAFAQYWDILNANAFGNFRKLLEDVTLSPAMGYYLNTKGNQKEDTNSGRVPDENYAREVMQLFTIGLYKLNPDGTEQVGSDGKKIESYTQEDVTNLARVFTGYDFDTSDGERVQVLKQDGSAETYTQSGRAFTQKPMSFNQARHSILKADFLGATVPAGETGAKALKIALDTLFNHPNTAPFFAKQMIQRLVTSNPSRAYVARVAAAFVNDGKGERGNLKAVWTAILLDDETRAPATLTNTTFGKLREPMVRFIQWGRSFGLASRGNSWKVFDTSDAAAQLGQSPLRSPSVFNFFRPGFVPPGTALAASQAPAPEFQLVNETTVGGYINFLQDRIRSGLYTGNPDVPQLTSGEAYSLTIVPTYSKELAIAADTAALVRRVNLIMCAGQLSVPTQDLIVATLNAKQLTNASPTNEKLDRIAACVLLAMASAEYLVQK